MANYARVTLTQIQGFLKERVGNNDVFWPTADATDAINHAIRIWQAMTGEWTASATLTRNGTAVIPLSAGYAPFRVLWNGTPLTETTVQDLDFGVPTWQNSLGVPTMWANVGATQVALYPTPSTNSGTAIVLQADPVLAAGGDIIQVGDEELQKLLDYAHHYMTWKEGISEMEATKGALVGLIEAAGRRNAEIRRTNFYRSHMGGKGKPIPAQVEALGVRGG